MRIERNEMLMWFAYIASLRSTCNRLHVGAVIAIDGRVVSTGYAGAPSRMEHCSPSTCNVDQPCTRTVHAEAGAITYAARHGIRLSGATLYCTHAPCLECAKLIINTGITDVYYETPYRKTEGIQLLLAAGIAITQWTRGELPVMPPVGVGRDHLHVGVRPEEENNAHTGCPESSGGSNG